MKFHCFLLHWHCSQIKTRAIPRWLNWNACKTQPGTAQEAALSLVPMLWELPQWDQTLRWWDRTISQAEGSSEMLTLRQKEVEVFPLSVGCPVQTSPVAVCVSSTGRRVLLSNDGLQHTSPGQRQPIFLPFASTWAPWVLPEIWGTKLIGSFS